MTVNCEPLPFTPTPSTQPAKKDFASASDVRWCPGCGDYAVLNAIQMALPRLNKARENFAVISGIGCSSRFPYYMETYGIHGIHGRAPAIATGLKVARPELEVWVITGDGDGLSIGGNHFIHAIRRNIGLRIVLFNNRIYGLTKGQFSPTSELGKKTKSSPFGTVDYPFEPLAIATGAEGTFIARAIDGDPKHLAGIVERACAHSGTTLIEVLQNCVIFNDAAWNHVTDKEVREDATVVLEHGKPLVFGKERNKGVKLAGTTPQVVTLGQGGATLDDLWVHDEHDPDPARAFVLAKLHQFPGLPVPVGILRDIHRPTYEAMLEDQIAKAVADKGAGTLRQLLYAGETWEVT